MKPKGWLPVMGIAFAAFIFNTSEFIPIGLLCDIAEDFNITESHAGLMITIYAWIVAATSLPLMIFASKMEYKKLLLCISGIFILSHGLSSVANNFTVLVISRMGVACSHAIFWSIASPLAVKVAPEGRGSTALSIVVTGSSIAMILGLPLGRAIGLAVGWRMTFLCIGAIAALVFLFILFLFPKTAGDGKISLRKLPHLFRNRALIGTYLMTVVFVTGHFTGYSYIEPFLAQIAGFSENGITLILTLFGVIGIIGSFLFSKYFNKMQLLFIRYSLIGVSCSLLLMELMSFSTASVLVLCIFWGLAINFYNLVFQLKIIEIAPQATAIAMSVYSGIYNVGIGSGALTGGLVCNDFSIGIIGYVGGFLAALATLYFLFRLTPIYRRKGFLPKG